MVGQGVGHPLCPGQAMFGRVDQAEHPRLQFSARRRRELRNGRLQGRFQTQTVGVRRALIADHGVQGLDDHFAGRDPRQETPLRGKAVQQFAQRREQVRVAVVAHPLRQDGTETVDNLVERHANRCGAGRNRRAKFLGRNAPRELRGQEACGIGKRSGGGRGLIQLVAAPA